MYRMPPTQTLNSLIKFHMHDQSISLKIILDFAWYGMNFGKGYSYG